MTWPFGSVSRWRPSPSFVSRLLAGADAALAEPAPDFVLPPFPFLPRTNPDAGTVQRNSSPVTVQQEADCA